MLGAHGGSLYRNVVAHSRDLGASGDRAPVRQQPCHTPPTEGHRKFLGTPSYSTVQMYIDSLFGVKD